MWNCGDPNLLVPSPHSSWNACLLTDFIHLSRPTVGLHTEGGHRYEQSRRKLTTATHDPQPTSSFIKNKNNQTLSKSTGEKPAEWTRKILKKKKKDCWGNRDNSGNERELRDLKEYCILLTMNFLPKNKLWKSINQKIRKEFLKINKWLPI